MTTPIVLLHPLGADRHFWAPVLDALGPLPSAALDLPGHGASPALESGAGIEAYSNAVASQIAEPAHLVGLSLGGLVAQQLAASRPEIVASVVLVDAVAVYPDPMRQMWCDRAAIARDGRLDSLIDPMVAMWFTDALIDSGDVRVEQARKTFGETDPEGYARACELLADVDLRDQVRALVPPSLVVCGEDDAPPFREAAEWLAMTTGGGPVSWLPGRHACAVEHPERFAALLTGLVPA